jgi:hypothetical protein
VIRITTVVGAFLARAGSALASTISVHGLTSAGARA